VSECVCVRGDLGQGRLMRSKDVNVNAGVGGHMLYVYVQACEVFKHVVLDQ